MKTLKVGITLLTALALFPAFAQTAQSVPKLILQITVDQLRGDLPGRYAGRYGDGGFLYLLEKGAHYTNAHYQHSNLETIVGHVTLATGAFPAAHGLVANVWLDRETGELGYAIVSGEEGNGKIETRSRATPASPLGTRGVAEGRAR